MFDVTDTYKTLIKQPTRYVGISGAVKLRSGNVVQFTDKNIVSGSLSITDRLNRRGDFRPGGVYSSGLSIGFTGLFAKTNDLDGAVIRLNYHIYPNAEMKASEAQTVPLGRFYVDGSTIKRTRSTVRLKADDGLMLFDVPATERSGTLYELVTGACAAAGVGFAMSQEEFEALPNATLSATINTARVQNERDLLMYVGMITGSFARITRSALALEFVPLTCEKDESTHTIIPVREIAGNIRFKTDFSDDTTRIAKLLMRRNGTALYSSYNVTASGSEKLATLELDENPLLSALTDDEVKTALNALLAQLYHCLNRVFDAEFTGDPALEVGDYVRLRGGEIDTDRGYATGMITSQTWTYHGTHQIRCSMPSSLVYSGEESAVMLLADDEETTTAKAERVQPKSQLEKRLDDAEAQIKANANGAVGMRSPIDPTSEIFNSYDGNNVAGKENQSCYASARGRWTQATGEYSSAEGSGSQATGNSAHAEGGGTQATGYAAHAEGGGTTASGNDAHAEGGSTKASGNYSHAEGSDSLATAYCAHAEGGSTQATQQYAHSEGCGTKASGYQAHVEGLWSEASGNSSHAEGEGCKSTGSGSHAQGMNCVASGFLSHAGGRDSTAGLSQSFAHGNGLQTAENGQTSTALFGEYNDYSDTNVIFAVGNGSSDSSRSNAFAVDKEGNIYCKSIIQTGATAAASLLSDDTAEPPTYTAQSDNVVEFGGVTYTFTVADTGEYTGVTTSTGKSMIANIPAELGNTTTHNAAFMALAIMSLK